MLTQDIVKTTTSKTPNELKQEEWKDIGNQEIYKNLDLNNLPSEIWKDIVGYEGKYQISNLGRIKTLYRKLNILGRGRQVINVAIMKQANRKGYFLEKIKSNNMNRGIKNKLSNFTNEDVLNIKNSYKNREKSSVQIAKEYNVSKTTILYILSGKNWKNVT